MSLDHLATPNMPEVLGGDGVWTQPRVVDILADGEGKFALHEAALRLVFASVNL